MTDMREVGTLALTKSQEKQNKKKRSDPLFFCSKKTKHRKGLTMELPLYG